MGVGFGMLAKGQSRVGSGKGREEWILLKGLKELSRQVSVQERRDVKDGQAMCVEGRGGGVYAIVVIKCAPHAP